MSLGKPVVKVAVALKEKLRRGVPGFWSVVGSSGLLHGIQFLLSGRADNTSNSLSSRLKNSHKSKT